MRWALHNLRLLRSYSVQLHWNKRAHRYSQAQADTSVPANTIYGRNKLNVTADDVVTRHLVRAFDAALKMNLEQALTLLKRISHSKSVDSQTFSALLSMYTAQIKELQSIVDFVVALPKLFPRLTYPPTQCVAYALHCAAQSPSSDSRNEARSTLTNLWTKQYQRRMHEVLAHTNILSQDDLDRLQGASCAIVDDTSFGSLSPLEILQQPMDLTSFGNLARRFPNYLDLCDRLEATQRSRFDRLYDHFNYNRQRALEMRPEFDPVSKKSKDKAEDLVWTWIMAVKDHLTKDFGNDLDKYSPALTKIRAKLPLILVSEMLVFAIKNTPDNTRGRRVTQLAKKIGRAVEDEYLNYLARTASLASDNALSRAQLAMQMPYKQMYWNLTDMARWTDPDLIRIGVSLLTLALNLCKIQASEQGQQQLLPAFYHSYEISRSKHVGVVLVNPALYETLVCQDQSQLFSHLSVHRKLPMLVQPRPFTSDSQGGYVFSRLSLLGGQLGGGSEQRAYLKESVTSEAADRLLRGLDVLSSCAWAVNRKVLAVVDALYKTGEEHLDIPGDYGQSLVSKSRRNKQLAANKAAERLSYGFALQVARSLAVNGDRFYYPYQIDFRGRAYPVCGSGFTHMGQDSIRALLQFWHGKPLGTNGLRWLKIHLANMYGIDKVTNDQRQAFAEDNMHHIRQSATNPLQYEWWKRAEKPFQALAACFELTEAMEYEDPTTFVSRIAVNQDGSCNGLQHYAALALDVEGARQVNMTKEPMPQDIYSRVSDIVSEMIVQEAKTSPLALGLVGKVSRKTVKQPVMTTVYGVTAFGAVAQVAERLKEDRSISPAQVRAYASYVVSKIQAAQAHLFSQASQVQAWLKECAIRITQSARGDYYGKDLVSDRDFGHKHFTSVIWTSPLGLAVVQPYRNHEILHVRTPLQTLTLVNQFALAPVNVLRQRNGIAPNFIHTMDAAHMFMTALACQDKGVSSFSAVHDSFWVHASQVDELSSTLRLEFMSLYSTDWIQQLYAEFCQRYAGHMLLDSVDETQPAYAEILALRQKHGLGGVDALRQELLWDYENWFYGKRHKTPASIIKRTRSFTKTARGSQSPEVPAEEQTPETSKVKSVQVFVPMVLPSPPERGQYHISSVQDSEYFFS